MTAFHNEIQQAMAHPNLASLRWPEVRGSETLASWFDVSSFASATFGAAAAALVRYIESFGYPVAHHVIEQRLVNLWFGFTLQPLDFTIPAAWDSIAGDYQTSDGWIRLHTNAPHHKQKALAVLGCNNAQLNNRDSVAQAVKRWRASALELAIVEQGGCPAQMLSIEQWQQHAHGKLLRAEPLICWQSQLGFDPKKVIIDPTQPLQGVKILDLTRVLAGPVASRFLAGFGAEVLRIDPPDWEEPSVIPEVTLGKRCAALDLKSTQGKTRLSELIETADVIVHGYRTDALQGLGFNDSQLHQLNPKLINVCLNAYGWQGPWQNRRGFDSLVQMSSGIAHYGMQRSKAGKPTPLPVQALDHGTGYLLAAAVIQALELRAHSGEVSTAKLSLARTANLLLPNALQVATAEMTSISEVDFAPVIENTSWGKAKRVRFPMVASPIQPKWPNGAVALRSNEARWQS